MSVHVWIQLILILCHCREKTFLCSFLPCVPAWTVLIMASVVVGGHIQIEVVLQLPLQGFECGPILFILLPAVHHDVIHDFGAAWGAWHPVALGNPLNHLVVGHGWKNHSKDIIQKLSLQQTIIWH